MHTSSGERGILWGPPAGVQHWPANPRKVHLFSAVLMLRTKNWSKVNKQLLLFKLLNFGFIWEGRTVET